MSKMKKCLGCKQEFKPETDEEMFCSQDCRGWCRISIESMVSGLVSDEDIFAVFDCVQLLWKKQAQKGGEES